MKKYFSIAFIVISSILTSPSYAFGRVVFDPSNYSKNLVSAAQLLVNEINQLKQLEQQLKANAKSITGDKSGVIQQLADMKKTMSSLQQLEKSVGKGTQAWSQVQGVFAAGDYKTWEDYTNVMAKRKAAGDATAKVLFESSQAASESMDSATEAYKRVLQSSDSIAGATEGAQAIVQSVGVLVQQNKVIAAALGAQNNKAGVEAAKKTQEEDNAAASIRAYDQARAQAYEADKAKYGNRSNKQ